MTFRIVHVLAITGAVALCAPSAAQDQANDARLHRVVGEKLDSGLGKLPHYREWRDPWKTAAPKVVGRINPVLGEKLDSGLGDLPRYRSPSSAPAAVRTASK